MPLAFGLARSLVCLTLLLLAGLPAARAEPRAGGLPAAAPPMVSPVQAVPKPAPAKTPARPEKPADTAAAAAASEAARAARAQSLAAVSTWAAQMQNMNVASAALAPIDLIVADATSGAEGGKPLTEDDVRRLKAKPDGSRRLAISYLSIGESEDYRPDYFDSEYMTEDAPDWLLQENRKWKGNRLIRFCEEGWQRTILGDADGRSLYSSIEPSPLYKLIELGFDGVYLDRVDVYSEVAKECPDAAHRMVEFVARLAAHARRKNPNFIVILQNAEELLANPKMLNSIDAIAKEDLFYGADHSERENSPAMVKTILENLALARAAGKPVFVLDYLHDAGRRAADKAKIEAQGFIPYFGPRKLDQLWLPGAHF